ncbi:MAG: hypothetical protein K2X47_12030 [Bdellovibrionales bacterium]|nr:hypothetical protein [Bdellovibrionales bacterium]
MGFYLSIGSIVAAFILYTFLVLRNLKELRETKQERLEARRAYRRMRAERWKNYSQSIPIELAARRAEHGGSINKLTKP